MAFLAHLPRIGLEFEGQPLGTEIALADGFFSRLRGLMFAPPLPPGRGLLIVPCNGIHTLGLRGALEAVFLSREGRVLKISSALPPWRGLSFCPGAHAVLEWAVGEAAYFGVREGARLDWARLRGQDALPPAREAKP
jgi:uncharacterized membrane protein (UPF0127 family)